MMFHIIHKVQRLQVDPHVIQSYDGNNIVQLQDHQESALEFLLVPPLHQLHFDIQ